MKNAGTASMTRLQKVRGGNKHIPAASSLALFGM